ncbi:hypothetical protein AOQ73_18130 [Bradyrhizobium pachyrhizi]|uniref:DUF3825 domain-containing protein n=1 Tax=Bradyrhizobium pachyrhizi TaxID=280333 RepID=UPI0007055902|nr:DUF3825 domain-containing protein [Bradyrhizobium pachyrhizi]KRQ01273.1 hypothetical protein AOQ73_18130 [Bradyrhizobium pachyrhizi]
MTTKKWTVFPSRLNEWTQPFDAFQIAQLIIRGDVDLTDKVRAMDGQTVSRVELLPEIMAKLAHLKLREITVHHPSYQVMHTPLRAAGTLKVSSITLSSPPSEDKLIHPTTTSQQQKPTGWNFHGSLTDGSLKRASETDDLANQFDQLIRREFPGRSQQSLDVASRAEGGDDVAAEKMPDEELSEVGSTIEPTALPDPNVVISSGLEPGLAKNGVVPAHAPVPSHGANQNAERDLAETAASASSSRPDSSSQSNRWTGSSLRAIDPTQFLKELDTLEHNRRRRRDAGDKKQSSPPYLLTQWADIDVDPRIDKKTGAIADPHMPELQKLAAHEAWGFVGSRDSLAILRSYLRLTFYRVFCEQKISFTSDHACFDTGLVDDAHRPIYAVFVRNNDRKALRRYKFKGFCVTGEGVLGKWFMAKFTSDMQPPAAFYFPRPNDLIIRPGVKITLQASHFIDKGISVGRFPLRYLLSILPPGVEMPGTDTPTNGWLQKYVESLNRHRTFKENFVDRLQGLANSALRRARGNLNVAVPNYFPTRDRTTLMLPIALLGNAEPDIALIISPVHEGDVDWFANTVYTLGMAYSAARVISKPSADWLRIEKIKPVAEEDMMGEDDG